MQIIVVHLVSLRHLTELKHTFPDLILVLFPALVLALVLVTLAVAGLLQVIVLGGLHHHLRYRLSVELCRYGDRVVLLLVQPVEPNED